MTSMLGSIQTFCTSKTGVKNYKPILGKITNIIKTWNKRILTPVGKIAVIKSPLLSKFVHLFQTLPMPPPNVVSKITGLKN